MIGRLLAAEPALSDRELGERLGVSTRTVKEYVRRLKAEMGLPAKHSRIHLILRLTAQGDRRPVPLASLTRPERRVLECVLRGNNRRETAQLLGWTTRNDASTVGHKLSSIYDKLGADGVLDLVSRFCL